jgi:hypothetical protein
LREIVAELPRMDEVRKRFAAMASGPGVHAPTGFRRGFHHWRPT